MEPREGAELTAGEKYQRSNRAVTMACETVVAFADGRMDNRQEVNSRIDDLGVMRQEGYIFSVFEWELIAGAISKFLMEVEDIRGLYIFELVRVLPSWYSVSIINQVVSTVKEEQYLTQDGAHKRFMAVFTLGHIVISEFGSRWARREGTNSSSLLLNAFDILKLYILCEKYLPIITDINFVFLLGCIDAYGEEGRYLLGSLWRREEVGAAVKA